MFLPSSTFPSLTFPPLPRPKGFFFLLAVAPSPRRTFFAFTLADRLSRRSRFFASRWYLTVRLRNLLSIARPNQGPGPPSFLFSSSNRGLRGCKGTNSLTLEQMIPEQMIESTMIAHTMGITSSTETMIAHAAEKTSSALEIIISEPMTEEQ